MQYTMYNGPMVTTSGPTPVTTGTSLKTMMQVKAGATSLMKVKAWGYSFSGFAAAAPGVIELIETDVAATVTAYVASGITKSDAAALLAGDPTTSLIEVGTGASGYTASVEGSTTASRWLDGPAQSAPTTQYAWAFPLGDEPVIQPGKFLRVRVLFGAAVNMLCWAKVEV